MGNAISPSILKTPADVIPVLKRAAGPIRTTIYLSVSFPNISNIFERCMYQQESAYFGFRIGQSGQHCLLLMIENLNTFPDQGKSLGPFLADHSKAFDSLRHDIRIAKLKAYIWL